MQFTNLIINTDNLFTVCFRKNALSKKAHSLKQQGERAKEDYRRAYNELTDASRMRYAQPAGWYECHLAKLKVNRCETIMNQIYRQLESELRRCLATIKEE